MRAPLFIALSLALGLTACNQQQQPPAPREQAQQIAGPAPVPADAPAVRGQINIAGLTDLPRGLQLRLRLLDMSDPAAVPPVVAERIEPAPGSLPYTFALPYDPAAIAAEGRYVVEAALLADQFVMYGTPIPTPVLTNGGGDRINVELTRGGTVAQDVSPADVLLAEFEALEASIGGMRRLTGERIEGDTTRGWDAFADDAGVRFAREVVDYGEAGTAEFRFAYRNGEPWVIARQQRDTLTLVGWGDDGSLLLNRVGEANGGADEAEVTRLRGMAEELHKIASRQLR
jgi:putative lipoprotein